VVTRIEPITADGDGPGPYHKGRLPEARALLYEETVDILLWRREQVKASGEDEAPPLRQLLLQADRTDVDLALSFWCSGL
jgi:hypothetical protein